MAQAQGLCELEVVTGRGSSVSSTKHRAVLSGRRRLLRSLHGEPAAAVIVAVRAEVARRMEGLVGCKFPASADRPHALLEEWNGGGSALIALLESKRDAAAMRRTRLFGLSKS
jgi:hypothetical protein